MRKSRIRSCLFATLLIPLVAGCEHISLSSIGTNDCGQLNSFSSQEKGLEKAGEYSRKNYIEELEGTCLFPIFNGGVYPVSDSYFGVTYKKPIRLFR